MKMTPDNVLHYLQKRGLLDGEALIRGKYAIYPLKTRNRILQVVTPDKPLFMKQMERDSISDYMFRRESNALELLKRREEQTTSRLQVPRLIDRDPENNILISELIPDTLSLHDYLMHSQNFPEALAEEQAHILSSCHQVRPGHTEIAAFPRLVPWILQLHKHDSQAYFKDSEASSGVIRIIQENELLSRELQRLHDQWQATHLVHGDVKWVNFLIGKNGSPGSQRLIDWELADIGDPLWDVAGLLNSYLVAWLFGFDNNAPQTYTHPERMKAFHYLNTRSSAKSFLARYMQLREIPESDQAAFLVRTMKYTAARVLQTSIEGINYNLKVEANNMRCVQLAHNIFRDPQQALTEFFNIQNTEYVIA